MYPNIIQRDRSRGYGQKFSNSFINTNNENMLKNYPNQTNFVTSTYSSSFMSPNHSNIGSNNHNNVFTTHSNKYKDYYNEHQDYRSSSYSNISSFIPTSTHNLHNNNNFSNTNNNFTNINNNFTNNNNNNFTNTNNNFYHQSNNFNQTTPHLYRTLSDNNQNGERKRFFTIMNNNIDDKKQDNLMYKNQEDNSINNNPKKDLYKFVKDKLASSKVDNNNINHIQSYNQQNQINQQSKFNQQNQTYLSQIIPQKNNSQYLQKANKKISLKRDIISPRHSHIQNNDNRFRSTSFFQPINNTNSNYSKNNQQTDYGSNSNIDLFKNEQNKNQQQKQLIFKKKQSQVYEYNNFNYQLGKSKVSQRQLIIENKGNTPKSTIDENKLGNMKNTGVIIKNNNLINKNNNNITNNKSIIDTQVYTNIKSHKIQDFPLQFSIKIDTLFQKVQLLQQKSQIHSINISNLTSSISHLRVSNVSDSQQNQLTNNNHVNDIKRIKKQLKIIKTNFQTAFTSMTEQINRKLIKQETIMKQLSDEIKILTKDNQKNQQIQSIIKAENQQKINKLQNNMLKYIKQNQQRIQSITLNNMMSDSFSSKRSKNSFQYGLDLKNMSGEESFSVNKQNIKQVNDKFKQINRQIKKMKVFHIEQQEQYKQKFKDIQEHINLQTSKIHQQINLIKSINNQIGHKIINKFENQTKKQFQNMIQQYTQMKIKQFEMFFQSKYNNNKYDQKIKINKEQIQQIRIKLQSIDKQLINGHRQSNYEIRSQKQFVYNNSNHNRINSNHMYSNSNQEIQVKLSQIQLKHRQIFNRVTQLQQKLMNSQQKILNITKSNQDMKSKQLKNTNEIRNLTSSIQQLKKQFIPLNQSSKQYQIQLHSIKSSISRNQQKLISHSNILLNHATLINQFNDKMKQLDKINSIQTQNIQSINSQFQRVINKQIIPKFTEIHHANSEVNFKLNKLNSQINIFNISKKSDYVYNINNKNNNNQINQPNTIDKQNIDLLIKNYFEQHIIKFFSKAKLIQCSNLTQKHQQYHQTMKLYDKLKKKSNSLIQLKQFLDSDHIVNKQQQQSQEMIYFVDQDNYLLDFQGNYLMEIKDNAKKQKIKINDEIMYFMIANGVNVKELKSNQ